MVQKLGSDFTHKHIGNANVILSQQFRLEDTTTP